MTIYDKGLIRAMKAAYRDSGYDVAVTDYGVLIQATGWGVEIQADAVPNTVKSLIVLHNGSMPKIDTAVHLEKGECSDMILETAVSTMDDLAAAYTAAGGRAIKPTRLTFDGDRVWQTADTMEVRLVSVDDQQILAGENWDARLVNGIIYGRNWFGSMYIRTVTVVSEDRPLLEHLAQMQWVPVDGV